MATPENFLPPGSAETQVVTISGTGTLSNAANLLDKASLVGAITGTGWAAATMGFQVSMDGSSYADLYDSSGVFATSTNTGAFALAVNPQLTAGWKYVKVKSSANQVNQNITLVKRPV